jgi:hypothetical protein
MLKLEGEVALQHCPASSIAIRMKADLRKDVLGVLEQLLCASMQCCGEQQLPLLSSYRGNLPLLLMLLDLKTVVASVLHIMQV